MVLLLHCSPIILILLVEVTICFTQELSGHVCYDKVTEIRSGKTSRRTFSIGCHCEVTRYALVYVSYTAFVNRCCSGWIQTGNNCSLPCTDNTYGQNCSETCNCTSVNSYCNPIGGCLCMAGWKEPNCSSPCDPGSYGFACRKNYSCLNCASCDPVSGSCNCTPGWLGSACNVTCPAGRYGNDCQENCTCLEGAVCDPVNGSCSCTPDRIGPNCTFLEESTTQTPVMQENNPLESDSTARLFGIVASVVSGVCIIIAIVGGVLWHISKHYRGFVKVRRTSFQSIRQNGNAVSGGHGDSDNVLPIRFTETGQHENRSADELAQASSQHSLGQAPEEVTDTVNVNPGIAAYQEIPTNVLNEARPSDAQSRPGTSRRNRSDRLPSTTPIARCSWSTDENAYSELGNYSTPTQKKAVPAKPSFPVRPYGRKVSPTDGDCSNDSYTWSKEKGKPKPPLPTRHNQEPESVSAYAVNSIVEQTRSSIKKYAKPANRVRHIPKSADVRNTSSGATTKHTRRFGEQIGPTVVTGGTTEGVDTAALPGEPVYFIVHPEPSSDNSDEN